MKYNLRISLFCCLGGLFTAWVYFLLRFGLNDNSFAEALKVGGILFFLVLAPFAVNETAIGKGKSELYYHPVSILMICFALMILVGYGLKFYPSVVPGWLFSGVGIGLFIWCLYRYVRMSRWIDYVVGMPLIFAFALFCTGAIYSNFAKPVFFETLVTYLPKTWRVDTLIHTALAQMIHTYGTPTYGLDGTSFINYHLGSHFVFSCFSDLLGFDILKFYNFAYPAIFPSIFFFVFLYFIQQVYRLIQSKEQTLDMGYVFWMLFIGSLLGFVKRPLIWHNGLEASAPGGMGNVSILVSESYLLSMIFLFTLFIYLVLRVKISPSDRKESLFYIFFLPLILLIICLTKISTGYITFAVLGYLYLRFALFKIWKYNLSLVMCTGVFIGTYLVTVEQGSSDGTFTFQFFKENTREFIATFLSLQYAATYLLVIFFLFFEKVGSLSRLVAVVRERKSLLVEIALVVAAAGLVPVSILNIGVNRVFFSEVQYFVSIGILIAYVSLSIRGVKIFIRHAFIRKVLYVASFVFMFDIYYANADDYMRSMVDTNFDFRKKVIQDSTNFHPRLKILEYTREGKGAVVDSVISAYGARVQDSLNKKKEYILLNQLRVLNALPRSEKKESLVFIDYRNSGMKFNIYCFEVVFFGPALSGIAQLKGTTTEEECPFTAYGMQLFPFRDKEEAKKQYSDSELCAMVTEKGFRKLIIYRPHLKNFETLLCTH